MTKIYVVMGTTGKHPIKENWLVKAFFDELKAHEWVEKATKRAREILHQYDNNSELFKERMLIKNEYDDKMPWSFWGIQYYYEETTFED